MGRARQRLGCAALAAVALAAAQPARAAAPDAPAACFPACRSSYLCHEGTCVSACNPPCGAAETCTPTGECAPATPPAPTVLLGGAPGAADPAPVVDPGWARGAFYFGATAVALDVALTAAVMAKNPGEPGMARTLGSWSIAVFGITAPITALGAASARTHPAVTGHPRLRVASWVGYALTLGEAAWLLSRSHTAVIGNGYVLSVGLLGTLSTLGFTLDARASAAQTERLQSTRLSQPTISLATGTAGGLVPTWGWVGTF